MMQDLSMSILDVCNNSLRAKASLIEVNIIDNSKLDFYSIEIKDNGIGMDEEMLKEVTNPFFTSRTTRRIGLGVPFFKELASLDGKFEIESKVGVGTRIKVGFRRSHIDKPPLGDLVGTVLTLISSNTKINYVIRYELNDELLLFDTREVKGVLEGVDINTPEIIIWLKNYLDNLYKKVRKN